MSLLCLEFTAKIYKYYSDYNNYIDVLHKYKVICHENDDYFNKMRFYKWLGRAYLDLKKYDKSFKYFKRMLIFAWALQHKEFEIRAYYFFFTVIDF